MKAVVMLPICPLKAQPRMDCDLADEALYGMVLEVLEDTGTGFFKVRTHYRYEGYAPAIALLTDPDKVAAWEALAPGDTPWSKNFADVMAEPKYQSWPLVSVPRGGLLSCGESENGWTRVTLPDGRTGYVRSSWVHGCRFDPGADADLLRRRLMDTAMLYFGTPYRWGGKTPQGIDCSGLVSMAYLLNGIVIHRDAHIKEGFPIREIPRAEMKPADLLFFPGHVAMYLGSGKYLHSTGKAGDDGVRINSLDPGDPDYREDLDKKMTAVGTYF